MTALAQAFPQLQYDVELAPMTTMKIGGKARYFLVVTTQDEVIRALEIARQEGMRVFFLGGGSNVLVSSKGFDGLVIKNEMRGMRVDGNKIWAESGVVLASVIKTAKEHGLLGIAALQGVPGTFGAGVRGNVGVPGCELGDFVVEARILMEDGLIQKVHRDFFEYAYRWSRLKGTRDFILDAVIELTPGGDPAQIGEDMMTMLKNRKAKQPWGQSGGSYFKNPSKAQSAGFLVEQVGGKAMQVGDAYISEKHANFFMNKGKATSEEMQVLADDIKKKVKDQFGVELHEEVEFVE